MLVFLLAEWPYAKTVALLTFAAAAITDALDGHLARRVYGVTSIGILLDPLADKVMICCALVGLVQLQQIPAWIVVMILSREFLVTGLRVLAGSQGRILSAGSWGKHKTIWQIVLILLILAGLSLGEDWLPDRIVNSALFVGQVKPGWDALIHWMAILTAGITVVSGALYFRENRHMIAGQMKQPGVRKGENLP
jgi:CDP-diacylglycerol--glycerol-3-phosphate 3-phosphatidyltransferase